MVWTVPKTWQLGETPGAATLNPDLRDNMLSLRSLNDCAAKVYRTSATQIITDSTRVAVSWQASAWTRGSPAPWVVGSPTRFTAPIAGYYLVSATVKWANNTVGVRGVGIRILGGVAYDLQFQDGAGVDVCSGMDIVYLLAGEWVEIVAFQSSGASLNLTGGSEQHTSAEFILMAAVSPPVPRWVPPRTWIDGGARGKVSRAQMNTQVRDQLLNLRGFKGASCWLDLDEDMSVEDSKRVMINWSLQWWNVGDMWTSGSKIVAPVRGIYLLTTNIEWSSDTLNNTVRGTGYRVNESGVNHDIQWQQGTATATQINLSGADLVELNAEDTLEVYVFQDSGESLSIRGGTQDRTRASLSLVAASE